MFPDILEIFEIGNLLVKDKEEMEIPTRNQDIVLNIVER